MICLDTHVVIWGLKGEATSGQEGMIHRTKQFIKHQFEEGNDLMIPAPVVSEVLIRGTTSQLQAVRDLMERSFFIPSFDMPAAYLAAELERSREAVELIDSGQAPREHIRVDTQIAAIAIIQNAEMIVSHDPYMRRIVHSRINVIEVPDIPEQETLEFSDS